MNSIHHVLRLNQLYDDYHHPHPNPHPGVVLVQFLFTLVWQLLQASLQDEGLLQHKSSLLFLDPDPYPDHDLTMELDTHPHKHALHAKNTSTAIQFIARFLHDKLTSRILSLVQRNMYVILLRTNLNLFVSLGFIFIKYSFAGQRTGEHSLMS